MGEDFHSQRFDIWAEGEVSYFADVRLAGKHQGHWAMMTVAVPLGAARPKDEGM